MSLDPYPDLPDTAADDDLPAERTALSEADSRLLDALSQHSPPVVRAVEDELRRPRTDEPVPVPPRPAPRPGDLTPVFREPTS